MSDSKDLWELGQSKGRQDERERLIKLLKTSELQWLNTFVATKEITARESFIALIKGEK